MCIVIDTNTLASVFKRDSLNHQDFEPVLDWVYTGKGKIVFGGTKYLDEIKKNYLGLFLQFKKAGKAIFIENDIVDNAEILATQTIAHNDFDDQHLVGLLRVSGCKLICSLDARAYTYFRHDLFFTPANKRPKIYSSRANALLLCDKNIAKICGPCLPTTNAQRNIIGVV